MQLVGAAAASLGFPAWSKPIPIDVKINVTWNTVTLPAVEVGQTFTVVNPGPEPMTVLGSPVGRIILRAGERLSSVNDGKRRPHILIG